MMVNADLPSFVFRTSNCPKPGNISEWNKASDRLGCPNRIESKSPKEQQNVYHCIPSNYLNETVEFCGKNVPIQGGMSSIIYTFISISNQIVLTCYHLQNKISVY